MVERMNPALPISQQCRLLAVPRSSVYRKPAEVGAEDLAIMALIDRHYLARPYYGSRRMAAWLATQGHRVNRKRVQRLMRLLGLAAIYQRPNASRQRRTRSIRTCCAGSRSSGSIRCGVPTSPPLSRGQALHPDGQGLCLPGGDHAPRTRRSDSESFGRRERNHFGFTWARSFAPRGVLNAGISGDFTDHILW